ncbi:MAG: aldo/keto reductase [Pseudomonadota bacterium]
MITSLDGTPISPLAFGTMQFGARADAQTSAAMFEASLEAGITHFDTAWVYTDGQSETLTGAFVKPHRERLIVATKVAYQGGAGRQNILAQFDASQQRLDMDVVDILYLHRFDPETVLAESFDALAQLQAAGRIRHIGVSNFAAWQIVQAQHIAARFDTRVDIVQPMHNLVKRQAEVEIFPACVDLGIEIAPYSPLGGGLLTGKYANGGAGRLSEDQRYAARYGEAWMHDTARALADLAAEMETDPATLAVAWAMAHPARPRPIISSRSVAQLAPSLAAASLAMDAKLYDRISRLTRTPPPATDRIEEA